jgi:hypothetical protein
LQDGAGGVGGEGKGKQHSRTLSSPPTSPSMVEIHISSPSPEAHGDLPLPSVEDVMGEGGTTFGAKGEEEEEEEEVNLQALPAGQADEAELVNNGDEDARVEGGVEVERPEVVAVVADGTTVEVMREEEEEGGVAVVHHRTSEEAEEEGVGSMPTSTETSEGEGGDANGDGQEGEGKGDGDGLEVIEGVGKGKPAAGNGGGGGGEGGGGEKKKKGKKGKGKK